MAFVMCGALSGLGGFMWASRYPTVDAVSATDFELDVITAVVIGGVNVFGGSGSVLGVVLGAVLVATIQNGFTLLHLSEFWKLFFNGFAIVVAVAINALVTHRLQDALRRRGGLRYSQRDIWRPRREAGASLRRALLARWEVLLIIAIVGVGIWSTTLSPFFLVRANLLDLLTPYAFIGLMALGLAFVVIAGEIDISVASILAVSVVCFSQLYDAGLNVWLALLAGLAVATALGCINGVLVGIFDLPSLAITLGTLAAYSGSPT